MSNIASIITSFRLLNKANLIGNTDYENVTLKQNSNDPQFSKIVFIDVFIGTESLTQKNVTNSFHIVVKSEYWINMVELFENLIY